MTFADVYNLSDSVERWERTIANRLRDVVEAGTVVAVDVDGTTGLAEATIRNATSDDIDAIDNELVYETVTRNPRDPSETWVSLGCITSE